MEVRDRGTRPVKAGRELANPAPLPLLYVPSLPCPYPKLTLALALPHSYPQHLTKRVRDRVEAGGGAGRLVVVGVEDDVLGGLG